MKQVVVISDLHCGHQAGLTPPDHSRASRNKFREIQKRTWEFYIKALESCGKIDCLVANGDMIDGKGAGSGGIELLTADRSEQVDMALEAINAAKAPRVAIVYGCLTAGHRILTNDLRWVNVEKLSVGDSIVGFEEYPKKTEQRRKWVNSIVLSNEPSEKEVYDLILSDGKKITATIDHPFLVKGGYNNYCWKTVEELIRYIHPPRGEGHSFYFPRIVPVWEEYTSKESGYIAGFFDGEGHCSYGKRKRISRGGSDEYVFRIGADQKNNCVLEKAMAILEERNIKFSCSNKNRDKDQYTIHILGSMAEKLQFLGLFRPIRLINKINIDKIGYVQSFYHEDTRIVDIIPAGKQTVYGLSTTSKTYVSEGFLSHNTPYHSGKEENWEDEIYKQVKVQKSIGWHEWIEAEGVVFDFKHKVGSSVIPHGRHTAPAREALWNVLWSERGLQPKAQIIVRSHVHYHQYAGGPGRLVMTTPCFQAFSQYGAGQCAGTIDLGLVWFKCEGGQYEWGSKLLDMQFTARKPLLLK